VQCYSRNAVVPCSGYPPEACSEIDYCEALSDGVCGPLQLVTTTGAPTSGSMLPPTATPGGETTTATVDCAAVAGENCQSYLGCVFAWSDTAAGLECRAEECRDSDRDAKGCALNPACTYTELVQACHVTDEEYGCRSISVVNACRLDGRCKTVGDACYEANADARCAFFDRN
jgi:hypothetical protein